jgi:transcriptional regulator with XRE-family HTH domain
MNLRGMSQLSLAGATGISQSAIHWWLTGKSMPRVEHLIKLSVHLGISIDSLLGLRELEDSEVARQEELEKLSRQFQQMAGRFADLTSVAPGVPPVANDTAVTDTTPSRRTSSGVQRLVGDATTVNQRHTGDRVDLVKHPRKGTR